MAKSRGSRGHVVGAIVRLAVLVAAVPVLWGAQCTPPPRSCGASGGTCDPGTISECVSACVVPRPQGATCSANPCDGLVCAYGLACTPFPGGARCFPPQSFSVFFCTATVPCATGNYCRRFTDSGGDLPRPQNAPPLGSGYIGQCVTPATEGSTCTGDWATHGTGPLCEAGMECLLDPRGPGRACFRGCNDAAVDCACASDDPAVLDDCVTTNLTEPPPPMSGFAGICAHCVANGAPFIAGSWDCCDPDSGTATGTCCHADGTACSEDSDCCGTANCAGDGTCHPCTPDLELHDTKGPGCCSGEAPIGGPGGLCPDTCLVGSERVVEGDPCCGTGEYICDDMTDLATCGGTDLPDEIFDCLDNNCDGEIDEGLSGGSCMGAPAPRPINDGSGDLITCQAGFVAPGLLDCHGDCIVTDGYCTYDSENPNANLIDDGIPAGTECVTGAGNCDLNGCREGEWCCSYKSGMPTCSRFGTIFNPATGLLDGITPLITMDCWEPTDNSVPADTECPYDRECFDVGHDSCESCVDETDPANCGWCVGWDMCLGGEGGGPPSGVDCGPTPAHWITETNPTTMMCVFP